MAQTMFHEKCRFCGNTRHELSSIGPDVCPRCETAIGITGSQPPGVTFDRYRDVILEVVAATDLAPRGPGEPWPSYKSRAVLVLNARREGRTIPASLLKPLSLEMQKSIDAGNSLSHVLLLASTLPTKPAVAEVKKPKKPERAVEKSTLKLRW
jgi:hypothetical protein